MRRRSIRFAINTATKRREIIPSSYAGVLVSDRGKSYEAEGVG